MSALESGGPRHLLAFPHHWRAEVLQAAPLIAPARQFTLPRQVAGDEDAMARGALQVMVHPAADPESGLPGIGPFLANCALGFADPAVPTGIWACPHPREICAVAGGYAYVIDTAAPERSSQIRLKPVVEVVSLAEHGLLVFAGFHALAAWGRDGLAWETKRLSWEGLRLAATEQHRLHGFGWDMRTDKEVAFAVDLRDGTHTGGAY